jgi:arsenate reductase
MAPSTVVFLALLLGASEPSPMNDSLTGYIKLRTMEFEQIPKDRRKQLDEIADYVSGQVKAGKTARLTFICTHNSRRSHLSQIWAKTAAAHFGVEPVETFSGGTEGTAFNPRAVAAIKRAGFLVQSRQPAEPTGNVEYEVKYDASADPMVCFSKVFSDARNPQHDYAAVMTCTQADEACPVVAGADRRFSLPYEDPKAFDGTPQEADKYDERTAQIACEQLYIFHRVAGK